MESYRIPWAKSGLLLTNVGRYTTPGLSGMTRVSGIPAAPTGDSPDADPVPDEPPAYLRVLNRLQNCRLPDKAVNGFGGQVPVFAASLPSNFVLRQGRSSQDPFFSGVFSRGGYNIGFIRIPSYAPLNTTAALTAFQTEIAYFQANTQGLVIDEMRNPGGSVGYLNAIVSLPDALQVAEHPLRSARHLRVGGRDLKCAGVGDGAGGAAIDLDQLQMIKDEIVAANSAMRGRTKPIPLDDVTIDRDPAKDSKGNVIAYTKPLIVLVDEMSASGGDAFAATIQDNAPRSARGMAHHGSRRKRGGVGGR